MDQTEQRHRPRSFRILSIGHSNLSHERFVNTLHAAGVTAVADVRSSPVSSYLPHFNRDSLCDSLRSEKIAYVFLGNELGGRPRNAGLYHRGIADYEKMATTTNFEEGLKRLLKGAERYQIALMCSEHDPLDCHRCLLVSRALMAREIDVQHVFHDGHIETQTQLEERLLASAKREHDDLFSPREERVALAYQERAKQIAFRLDERQP